MDGILNINKPAEWTSQDVCAKLRGRLHTKKIGHTGTLDPMATGVLPVCVGKATRIIEYFDKDFKTYHATMRLGVTTDTLDITGEITETHDCSNVSENKLREVFNAYTGVVSQIPPKYSALKVDGKRAYELAREGKAFELKPREIEIKSNEIAAIDLEEGIIEFDVTCSKGTYIRTLIDDIGRDLGCGAVMTALSRTASGYFKLEDAVELRHLMEMSDDEIANRMISMDKALINLGVAKLDDNRVTAFFNGNSSAAFSYKIIGSSNYDSLYKVYSGHKFLGIAELSEDSLIPRKVFY